MILRHSKYNARRTVVDGITFASRKEARRYQELKLMEKAGEIHHMVLQPKLKFKINGKVIFIYKADFTYRDFDKRKFIYEDVKGYRTPIYRLKKKLIEAQHGIKIQEV